jgi:hypothetical protein
LEKERFEIIEKVTMPQDMEIMYSLKSTGIKRSSASLYLP